MVECLPEEVAWELAVGQLAGDEARRAAKHLDGCARCRRWVSELARAEAHETPPTAEPSQPDTQPIAPGALALVEGERLGAYEIRRHLGSGGMSLVYAAFDPHLQRGVAIKVLRPGRATDTLKARLLREAKAMARLSHPNVLPVYEARELAGGAFYIAMELVEGMTLGRWLREKRRAWPEVLEVFRAAASGLAAAHAAGLVHRDFKPENVLIGDDGRVRVADFGLARWTDEEEGGDLSLTQSGAFVGTPVYMSPEHAPGGEVDARSDQFSFCVALYEACCGRRPFVGSNVTELWEAMRGGRIEPPLLGAPGWLRRIILRGLSPRPADRFASMDALKEALWRGERRHHRLQAALHVAVAVSLALTLGGFCWRYAMPSPAPPAAPPSLHAPAAAPPRLPEGPSPAEREPLRTQSIEPPAPSAPAGPAAPPKAARVPVTPPAPPRRGLALDAKSPYAR